MHPLFQSRRAAGAYALAWIPLGAAYAYLFAANPQLRASEVFFITADLIIFLALVCLTPFYSCRGLPLGSHPLWRLALLHALPAMFFSGLVLASNHVLLAGLGRFSSGVQLRFAPSVPVLAALCFMTYLLATAMHYTFQAIQVSQRAELLSREAQLTALKAQVNPHFLFNSLNSISALTAIDPMRARQMCVRLSDFLRSSLQLGERSSIRFDEELALVKGYLDVEQVRFGDRLRLLEEIDAACLDCQVPPLVIQPLIENAVKHGVATLTEPGKLSVRAEKTHDGLRVTVENDFDPDAPAASRSGFGIQNVRNRLKARFGSTASLTVSADGTSFRAVLSAPCENPQRKQ